MLVPVRGKPAVSSNAQTNHGITTVLNFQTPSQDPNIGIGAIYNTGHMTIINTTISKNRAVFAQDTSFGGGILNRGILTLINNQWC
jgi:hypothetical protein